MNICYMFIGSVLGFAVTTVNETDKNPMPSGSSRYSRGNKYIKIRLRYLVNKGPNMNSHAKKYLQEVSVYSYNVWS